MLSITRPPKAGGAPTSAGSGRDRGGGEKGGAVRHATSPRRRAAALAAIRSFAETPSRWISASIAMAIRQTVE